MTAGAIGGLFVAGPVMHWLGSRWAIRAALLVIVAELAGLGADARGPFCRLRWPSSSPGQGSALWT